MRDQHDIEDWRTHADLTRRLAERAEREGNLALARELARLARAAERRLARAA